MNAMNWLVVYPEIVLLGMACLVTVVDLWVTDPARRLTFWMTQASMVVVGTDRGVGAGFSRRSASSPAA